MSGRVNDEIKKFKLIEEKIINYPDFVIEWYYNLKANENSSATCTDWVNKVKQFLYFINPDITKITPKDITEDIINKYFIKIQTKKEIINGKEFYSNTSDSYRQCIWSCLNNLFNYLADRNIMSQNIILAANIKRPKNKDLDRINRDRILLTKDDFKKILSTINTGTGSKKARTYQNKYKNRDLSIMLIFMTTGIRRNALREINTEDIDIEKKKLTVIDKGYKLHEYKLNDQTLKAIDDWMTDRFFLLGGEDVEDALFISRDNKRMSGTSIAELVDKYAYEALGYHVSPHKLRSGLASILYEEKHDIEFVRRVIGHSNVATTQRYIVTNNAEREETANIMGNIFK